MSFNIEGLGTPSINLHKVGHHPVDLTTISSKELLNYWTYNDRGTISGTKGGTNHE